MAEKFPIHFLAAIFVFFSTPFLVGWLFSFLAIVFAFCLEGKQKPIFSYLFPLQLFDYASVRIYCTYFYTVNNHLKFNSFIWRSLLHPPPLSIPVSRTHSFSQFTRSLHCYSKPNLSHVVVVHSVVVSLSYPHPALAPRAIAKTWK